MTTKTSRVWSDKYLGLINHVVFVVDASGSMRRIQTATLNLLHEQIKLLATRSEETGQETRVSVYFFDNDVECVVYDRDVLRPLDLSSVYVTRGMTALMDATRQGIHELSMSATIHGDHSYLFYVLTDGAENASKTTRPDTLRSIISRLGPEWTMTCFVPGPHEMTEAVKYGFPRSHVVQYDVSAEGMVRVNTMLAAATDTYFTGRASGVRGYQGGGLFDTSAAAVNAATVQASNLVPLDTKQYAMLPVRERVQTRPFVMSHGITYVNGTVYYQFMKTEHIQPQKAILVVEKATNRVFAGADARRLIGLPDGVTIKGRPTWNDQYEVYVQSTAPNRNLIPNTTCIVLNPKKS